MKIVLLLLVLAVSLVFAWDCTSCLEDCEKWDRRGPIYWKCERKCKENPIYVKMCLGMVLDDALSGRGTGTPCRECASTCEFYFFDNLKEIEDCTKDCQRKNCRKEKSLADIIELLK
jgi:hypothetical protein